MNKLLIVFSAAAFFASILLFHSGGQAKNTVAAGNAMGFESRYVNIDSLRFHYVEKGDGPIMLFLHGYPFFGASWQHLLTRFAATHKVIAPDLRGYGYTDKPQTVNQYHLQYLVEDVKALITQLSARQKVILVGHDWGGTLAWAVSQKYPQYIENLIVINAPPYNVLLDALQNDPAQREASKYMPLLKSDKVETAFLQSGPELLWKYGFDRMLDNNHITQDFKLAFYDSWNQPNSIRSAMNWYRANLPNVNAISDDIYWPKKGALVTSRSLLITTQNERTFVPATFSSIDSIVQDLHVEVIAKSGHTPFLDQPDQVEKVIRDFLKGD